MHQEAANEVICHPQRNDKLVSELWFTKNKKKRVLELTDDVLSCARKTFILINSMHIFMVCIFTRFFVLFFKGLTHEEAARLIANSYADRSVPELKLLMSPSTFRPNANYQPENWWSDFSHTAQHSDQFASAQLESALCFYSPAKPKAQVRGFYLFASIARLMFILLLMN